MEKSLRMKILIACEFSGVVRDAFSAKGHDAWSCDLLPTDKPGKHIQGDVLAFLNLGWDMMIAHPPCTYLCNGGQANATRRPHLKWRLHREEAVDFFMRFVNAPIPRIAIENPPGVMSSRYHRPNQIIFPYLFGHNFNKPTCLWLKNLPPLMATDIVAPPYKKLDFWSSKRNPNGRSLKSITFQGIANAMADQWELLV